MDTYTYICTYIYIYIYTYIFNFTLSSAPNTLSKQRLQGTCCLYTGSPVRSCHHGSNERACSARLVGSSAPLCMTLAMRLRFLPDGLYPKSSST